MGVTVLVFELQALKDKIKGAFNTLNCRYGNQLRYENGYNLFSNDWTFV